LHEEAFDQFDCLTCANSCSTISPIVTGKDIEKLAKYLKMKPSEFISQYLYIDEDKDYVFQQTPCPFLMPDNYCMVTSNAQSLPRIPAYRPKKILPDTQFNTQKL
jgi:Fe-S-cluster containining protein